MTVGWLAWPSRNSWNIGISDVMSLGPHLERPHDSLRRADRFGVGALDTAQRLHIPYPLREWSGQQMAAASYLFLTNRFAIGYANVESKKRFSHSHSHDGYGCEHNLQLNSNPSALTYPD